MLAVAVQTFLRLHRPSFASLESIISPRPCQALLRPFYFDQGKGLLVKSRGPEGVTPASGILCYAANLGDGLISIALKVETHRCCHWAFEVGALSRVAARNHGRAE